MQDPDSKFALTGVMCKYCIKKYEIKQAEWNVENRTKNSQKRFTVLYNNKY